jgi:hypothetical protein
MISNVKYGNGDRSEILNYLKSIKENNKNFKIIDIGGTYDGWSWPVLDAIVDINKCQDNRVKQFQFNICDHDSWSDLIDYVKQNGKFDFAICTHTLEDLSNPLLVCQQISKIAKSGYVAIPSKFIELSRLSQTGLEVNINGKGFRGYIHHRWIFQIENNKFIAYPKLNFLDADDFFDSIAKLDLSIRDLNFMWENKLELNIINNDFMGPGSSEVIKMFRDGLSKNEI